MSKIVRGKVGTVTPGDVLMRLKRAGWIEMCPSARYWTWMKRGRMLHFDNLERRFILNID
jgi:hypothetical protein